MATLIFTLAFLGIVAGTEMVIHPLEEETKEQQEIQHGQTLDRSRDQ